MQEDDPLRSEAATLVEDLRAALGFLTRLPPSLIGHAPEARPDFTRAARVFPVVGIIVGAIGGIVLLLADWLGESTWISAALAVAATMLATGGLHEDGLADTTDGFGGGETPERKLAIMDDSRIGTFGAAALVFSILLRVAALAGIAFFSAFTAAVVLVVAETVSRAAIVRLWHDQPPARPAGLSHDVGPPDSRAMLIALAIAGAVIVVLGIPTIGIEGAVVATLLAAVASYLFARLSLRAIGGRTGDTLGACQQIAAAAFLIGAAAAF